jgi:hypothetical protein
MLRTRFFFLLLNVNNSMDVPPDLIFVMCKYILSMYDILIFHCTESSITMNAQNSPVQQKKEKTWGKRIKFLAVAHGLPG